MSELLKPNLDKVLEHLKSESAGLRTGRASPALVEDLEVEYYGAKTSLKAIASIASPEPRQIVIQPWDKNALGPIQKAIQMSPLGINPIADKDMIRLVIPPLTEERRKELIKLLGRHLEDARIQVRREREDALKTVDALEKAKEISEDEKFRRKSEVQKIVDDANKKIEELGSAKEKEIMTV
ncbi:ribosome recycling factor [Patescibacteria group bacterium]|nr:ribosome recycling factor [Patescibacteria group bacterium]